MRTILTLKYGSKYSSDDVNAIYTATQGQYNYICLTDDPTGLHPNIKTIPVNPEYGTFNKVLMFGIENIGDVLYLDLDVHIQKDIVDIWNHISYNASVCYTHWKDDKFPTTTGEKNIEMNYLGNYNSSVMLWKSGTCGHIVQHFLSNEDYYMVKYHGDDRFLWHEPIEFNTFPKGLIYSFVYGADYENDKTNFKYRPEYTIALLNGQDQFPKVKQKYYDAVSLHKVG